MLLKPELIEPKLHTNRWKVKSQLHRRIRDLADHDDDTFVHRKMTLQSQESRMHKVGYK
jgi:hypothetical protein